MTSWLSKSMTIFCGLIFLLGLYVATSNSEKDALRSWFKGNTREVLATVDVSFTDLQRYRVVKIRSGNNLSLEFYKIDETGLHLAKKFSLPEQSDTLFTYAGKSGRLFIDDTNVDRIPRVLVTTVDLNMNPTLKVFHFDTLENQIYQDDK